MIHYTYLNYCDKCFLSGYNCKCENNKIIYIINNLENRQFINNKRNHYLREKKIERLLNFDI